MLIIVEYFKGCQLMRAMLCGCKPWDWEKKMVIIGKQIELPQNGMEYFCR